MPEQESLHLVTYCGLCAERARIPPQARQLRETLRLEGYDDWHQYVPHLKETYPDFVKFLEMLTTTDCNCRSGQGGPPDCEMRNCAKERKVDACPLCKDYPCAKVEAFAGRYPTLIQDGKRMQKIGVEKWIEEQEQRVKRGLVYADLRYDVH